MLKNTTAKPAYCPDIVEHVRKGDEPGRIFEEIVTCFGNDLKAFARYKCGSGPDADDTYQDALIAAHRYIGTFRGETPLKNWLLKLVNTACLQKRRGRKNNPRLHVPIDPKEHPEIEPLLASAEPSAEVQVMIKERIDCMRDALGGLSEKDRDLLVLHEGEGISIAELAAKHGMTVPGVKTRLFRARASVKKHMEAKKAKKAEAVAKTRTRVRGA